MKSKTAKKKFKKLSQEAIDSIWTTVESQGLGYGIWQGYFDDNIYKGTEVEYLVNQIKEPYTRLKEICSWCEENLSEGED